MYSVQVHNQLTAKQQVRYWQVKLTPGLTSFRDQVRCSIISKEVENCTEHSSLKNSVILDERERLTTNLINQGLIRLT